MCSHICALIRINCESLFRHHRHYHRSCRHRTITMLMWWKSLSLSWFADAIFIRSHRILRFQFQLLSVCAFTSLLAPIHGQTRVLEFFLIPLSVPISLRRKFMRTMCVGERVSARAYACHCSSNKCTKCVEPTHNHHRHRHQRSRFSKALREALKQCQYVYHTHTHLSKIYIVDSRNELKKNRLLSTYRRPPSSRKFHLAVFIQQFDICVHCVCVCICMRIYMEEAWRGCRQHWIKNPPKNAYTQQRTEQERHAHMHTLCVLYYFDIKRVNRIHLSPPHKSSNKCNHVIPYNSAHACYWNKMFDHCYEAGIRTGVGERWGAPKTFHLFTGWLDGWLTIATHSHAPA